MNARTELAIPESFAVTLPVTPEVIVKLKLADGALTTAQSYEIDSTDMAQIVADQRNGYLKTITTLKELKKGFVKPAKDIIANAEALFDPALEELDLAVKHLNGGLLTWDQKEKARIDQEHREREAEDRRIRQDAERKAAEETARAEAKAAEQYRIAAEAEKARQKALAEGNARAAAAAAAQVAVANKKADAAIENGQAKAAEAINTAAAVVAATPETHQAKIQGNSFRTNWVAEINPGLSEDDVKLLIVEAICNGRAELFALLDLNMSACNKTAKGFEGRTNIPGMTARNSPVTAGSRK